VLFKAEHVSCFSAKNLPGLVDFSANNTFLKMLKIIFVLLKQGFIFIAATFAEKYP